MFSHPPRPHAALQVERSKWLICSRISAVRRESVCLWSSDRGNPHFRVSRLFEDQRRNFWIHPNFETRLTLKACHCGSDGFWAQILVTLTTEEMGVKSSATTVPHHDSSSSMLHTFCFSSLVSLVYLLSSRCFDVWLGFEPPCFLVFWGQIKISSTWTENQTGVQRWQCLPHQGRDDTSGANNRRRFWAEMTWP